MPPAGQAVQDIQKKLSEFAFISNQIPSMPPSVPPASGDEEEMHPNMAVDLRDWIRRARSGAECNNPAILRYWYRVKQVRCAYFF